MMAGTTPICSYCDKPIVGDITWGCGVEVYHPECTAPWHRPDTPDGTELATLRARLAAAEKVVEAARRSHNGLGGVLRHTFADERQAMVQGIYLDLDEALTAYQEHSDG